METERIKQLRADMAAVALEVKPLAEKSRAGTLTAEEDARFDELVVRINGVKNELVKAEEQAARASEVLEINRQYNTPVDGVKRGIVVDTAGEPDNQGRSRRIVTIGQKFANSDEFKEYRGGPARTSSRKMHMPGLFPEYDRDADPDGTKAVISSGTASASMLLPQVLPGIYRPNEAPLVMRDVLLNLNTTSDAVIILQETAFTNNAAEVAESTANNGTGLTGGVKPISDLTFAEVSFPVRWIAHAVEISRQMLEDLAFIGGYVDTRLITGLKRRENAQALNGNGTTPNLTGLLQTSGIQTLDATYFTGAPVKDAGTANENLNRIRRSKTKIATTGKAQATFVVLNPADAEELDTITDSTRQYLLGGPLAPAQRRLWGLPIVETEDIAAKTALVGDGTMAAFVDRKDATIYSTDSHSDYFLRNLFVVLAEERLALPVMRPTAFAKVTLA